MEKRRVGCEANTKEKFNKGLVKEAKSIVAKVEGLNKTSTTKRSAEVRAAFGEKKTAGAAKSAAKKPAAKAAVAKSIAKAAAVKSMAKKTSAKAATAAKSMAKTTAKSATKKPVAKAAIKAVAVKPAVRKAAATAKAVVKKPVVHKTAVGRAIAAVERAVGIKALAAPTSKSMRTTKAVAKPAGKTMAKATPKRPLPKPAGISKGPHSGDAC